MCPLPASSLPLGRQHVTDPPVPKPCGYWWGPVYMEGWQTEMYFHKRWILPPCLSLRAGLKCYSSVYVRHECIVRKVYLPRYIMFVPVRKGTLNPCNERKEGGNV